MSDISASPDGAASSPSASSPAASSQGPRSPKRRTAAARSSDGGSSPRAPRARSEDDLAEENDDAGLFGEDSGDESVTRRNRTLDDEELDSGDDVGRRDRLDESEPEVEEKVINTVEISLGRHDVPKGSDGEVYLFRNSQGTAIEPQIFNHKTFKPPTTSHHGAPPLKGFSAAHTANTTIRWRRDPDDPSKLQSNSRIIRWSDGSLTLQIGTDASEQLELPAKSMAPQSQYHKQRSSKTNGSAGYDHSQDSHTYLASVHQDAQFIQLTNHVTTSLQVQTSSLAEDDTAVQRLQASMAAASKNYGRAHQDTGPAVMKNLEDPELAKKKAEAAEKEKARAERRRLNQEQRMRERQERAFGRPSGRSGYGGGLTIGGLEDDGLGRSRPKTARKPRRRGSEYSEDEDDYPRGKTREDEYDEDDGFLVGSDEEPEVVEDDDDEEEDILDDDAADDRGRAARSPKRSRDEDGEEGGGGGGGKRGRRMVLDDDDDDE